MTMNLCSAHGERTYNNRAWSKLMQLAVQYGWKPAGAVCPHQELEWPAPEDEPEEPSNEDSASPKWLQKLIEGAEHLPESEQRETQQILEEMLEEARLLKDVPESYFLNSGNRVSAEDARALADALERALPDVPDHDAMADKTFTDKRVPGARFLHPGVRANALEWFSGPRNKRVLEGFIRYCRQGGFEIW